MKRYLIFIFFALGFVSAQTKVISVGDEPRRVLNYLPAEGSVQNAEMAMRIAMSITMVGDEFPEETFASKLPTIILPMTLTIDNVSKDGVITSSFAYGEVSFSDESNVDPDLLAQFQESFKAFKDITGTIVSNSSGEMLDYKINVPESAPATLETYMTQAEDMLRQMVFAYPQEALGENAILENYQKISNQGVEMEQTITSTFSHLSDTMILASSQIEQVAEPRVMDLPDMPEGSVVNLVNMIGQGTGMTYSSPGKIFPISSAMASKTTMVMTIDMDGQHFQQTILLSMDVTLRSK